ncbi:MAG: hypothetical protein C4326_07415 [Ignavibacteria bacterium]
MASNDEQQTVWFTAGSVVKCMCPLERGQKRQANLQPFRATMNVEVVNKKIRQSVRTDTDTGSDQFAPAGITQP